MDYLDAPCGVANFNVHSGCLEDVVDLKTFIYDIVEQYFIQLGGAFPFKVVPWFRLNKFIHCVPVVVLFLSTL